MYYLIILTFITIINTKCFGELIFENDVNFRVEAGSRTCIFERGKAGQMMEVYYQVLDGQHGDLDISFDVIGPDTEKIVSDKKKSQNSIIMELELDGDYAFCLDNTYSLVNSKLVFVYILIENKKDDKKESEEAEVAVVDSEGKEEKEEEEVLEWGGTDENGEMYYLEVTDIADSLSRTLKHVVKARHLLDIYGATKARDSYVAFQDTFIVDVWSSFQISCMFVVGMLQVYMIKKLFQRSSDSYKIMY